MAASPFGTLCQKLGLARSNLWLYTLAVYPSACAEAVAIDVGKWDHISDLRDKCVLMGHYARKYYDSWTQLLVPLS